MILLNAAMTAVAPAMALFAGLIVLDALCDPRAGRPAHFRSASGLSVLLSAGTATVGALLTITGEPVTAVFVTLLVAGSLTLISNVKHKVLGEPLVFSDFALVLAVFQQPQFYLSALKRWHIALLIGAALGLVAGLTVFSNLEVGPRLVGVGLTLAGFAALALFVRAPVWRMVADAPDLSRDVGRHGLIASILVYWFFWRTLSDPPPCTLSARVVAGAPLVVIVQCESFTDPVEVFSDPSLALPGLTAARRAASQTGCLKVPGFGAYTMRTEYGVLFGRSEGALGLRRFDPFLTARGEASWALPHRLEEQRWTSLFLHPHDLGFYGRDRVMPAAGFDRIIGPEGFAPPAPGEGRYVTDAAVADTIIDLAAQATGPTLMYVVTIENHGPWPVADDSHEQPGAGYLKFLQNSDRMLQRLLVALPRLGRPVVFCFFGDHRPSIPKASEPGGERHTPYVILKFSADGAVCNSDTVLADLTPAELHHAILAAIPSGPREG